MYCKLKYVVIYLKLLTNFVILRSFGNLVYRIPLKYFCGLGKINFPTKFDLKIKCTLETEMKKLFESKKMLKQLKIGATAGSTNANDYGPATSPGTPDAQIIFLKVLFIQYE